MPIGVVLVSILLAMVTGEQDDKICHKIRERVNAIGDKAL